MRARSVPIRSRQEVAAVRAPLLRHKEQKGFPTDRVCRRWETRKECGKKFGRRVADRKAKGREASLANERLCKTSARENRVEAGELDENLDHDAAVLGAAFLGLVGCSRPLGTVADHVHLVERNLVL